MAIPPMAISMVLQAIVQQLTTNDIKTNRVVDRVLSRDTHKK